LLYHGQRFLAVVISCAASYLLWRVIDEHGAELDVLAHAAICNGR
jgi:hypothetical protein